MTSQSYKQDPSGNKSQFFFNTCICKPTNFAAHLRCGENIFSSEPATPNPGHFLLCYSLSLSLPITHINTYLDPTHNTETKYPRWLWHGVSAPQRLPSSLLLSVTDLLLGKSATLKGKKNNVKVALAFSPLHILLAKLMLCSAISIQAADSQPSPLPSSALARKSRLQRENVINSMERKHGLSIIHAPPCCYLRLSLSPPTPSDLAEAGPLSSSPLLSSMLSLFGSDICLLSRCSMHALALKHARTYTIPHGCRRGETVVTTEPKIF